MTSLRDEVMNYIRKAYKGEIEYTKPGLFDWRRSQKR